MQEEITQKTIALTVRTTKLTADVLIKMIKMYLGSRKQKAFQPKCGKQSVKDLISQDAGATSIEITEGNIKCFERVARKYKVDFAIKKDKTTEPPKYLVFFKGKDADVLTQAFKEFVQVNERKQNRVSVKAKLAEFKQVLEKHKNRERVRERNKDIGQSL